MSSQGSRRSKRSCWTSDDFEEYYGGVGVSNYDEDVKKFLEEHNAVDAMAQGKREAMLKDPFNPLISGLLAKTNNQMLEFNGALSARRETCHATNRFQNEHEQTLLREISRAKVNREALKEAFMEAQAALSDADRELLTYQESLQRTQGTIEKVRTECRLVEAQMEFLEYFLAGDTASLPKRMFAVCTLEEVRERMGLHKIADVARLSDIRVGEALKVLVNGGLEHNSYFQKLWDNPRDQKRSSCWERIHYNRARRIATGRGSVGIRIRQVRLANYLGLECTVDEMDREVESIRGVPTNITLGSHPPFVLQSIAEEDQMTFLANISQAALDMEYARRKSMG